MVMAAMMVMMMMMTIPHSLTIYQQGQDNDLLGPYEKETKIIMVTLPIVMAMATPAPLEIL